MSHAHRDRRILGSTACFIFLCGLFFVVNADLSARLKALTGSDHVKVVFTRCSAPQKDDFPTGMYSTDEVLVGFDTELGREDTLQTTVGNYQNPLITHNGFRIVYSVLSDSLNPGSGMKWVGYKGATYIVDWKKDAAPKKIANGMTACLWYDTKAQKEYAIYARNRGLSGEEFYKIAIDDSTDDKLLYAGISYSCWLRVSSNLRAIGGCMGDYSSNGAPLSVYDIATKEMLIDFSGNCWPSMPYDTTCRMVKINGSDHAGWGSKSLPDMLGDTLKTNCNLGFSLSQLRVGSYFADILLVVIDAWAIDNGTGHIFAVKTSPDFSKIVDSVTITSGIRADHHADLWAGKSVGLGSGSPRPSAGIAVIPDKGSVARIFTIEGRCIATVHCSNVAAIRASLPKKVYVLEYRSAGRRIVTPFAVTGR